MGLLNERKQAKIVARNKSILADWESGEHPKDLAEKYKLSITSIYGALNKAMEAQAKEQNVN